MGLSTYVVPDLHRLLGHTWKNTAIINFRGKKRISEGENYWYWLVVYYGVMLYEGVGTEEVRYLITFQYIPPSIIISYSLLYRYMLPSTRKKNFHMAIPSLWSDCHVFP